MTFGLFEQGDGFLYLGHAFALGNATKLDSRPAYLGGSGVAHLGCFVATRHSKPVVLARFANPRRVWFGV